ncbi:MAG: ferredoxin [Epsilonproteobacteria bacterium]|nr:MAG: ferredoxin [Campylobacterota bacterium]RLA66143.1 MAG: ferredoxin [Campylobacterota bacterium]
MADKSLKWSENVSGQFYVDENCIACDACIVEAPKFFIMNDQDGHAYVCAQPQTEEDIKSCMEALECCPVEAIGNDGAN